MFATLFGVFIFMFLGFIIVGTAFQLLLNILGSKYFWISLIGLAGYAYFVMIG